MDESEDIAVYRQYKESAQILIVIVVNWKSGNDMQMKENGIERVTVF